MQTLTKRKMNMEIAQTIDDVEEWYSERGLSVPQWRTRETLSGGSNI